MKKMCTKCLLEKPLTDFYRKGKESRCKKCFNEFVKLNAYPNRNAGRGNMSSPARKAAQARYREKNREQIRTAQRMWVKNNLPKVLAKTNKYQAAKHNATPKWLTKEHLKQIDLHKSRSIDQRDWHST